LPTSSGLPVAAAQGDVRSTTVPDASEFLTTVDSLRLSMMIRDPSSPRSDLQRFVTR
jgi:hypothetical protein